MYFQTNCIFVKKWGLFMLRQDWVVAESGADGNVSLSTIKNATDLDIRQYISSRIKEIRNGSEFFRGGTDTVDRVMQKTDSSSGLFGFADIGRVRVGITAVQINKLEKINPPKAMNRRCF